MKYYTILHSEYFRGYQSNNIVLKTRYMNAKMNIHMLRKQIEISFLAN